MSRERQDWEWGDDIANEDEEHTEDCGCYDCDPEPQERDEPSDYDYDQLP